MPKYHQGKFRPINQKKYVGDVNNIIYRSSWELKAMSYFDSNKSVIQWCSEEYPIPYYSTVDRKERRYFVDFIVKIQKKDGTIETKMVEVKPNKERFPPQPPKNKGAKARNRYLREYTSYQRNQDKWHAAVAFGKKNGMTFAVLDEFGLGIKKR